MVRDTIRKSAVLARLGLLLAGLLVSLLPSWAGAQVQFKRLVVFGDSLSDPGNAFVLLGTTNTPPDWSVDPFLVPDRPYARGGHHFSNGATWIEQMARPLGLAASVRPALRSASGATNYAIGGARARADGSGTDLGSQVQAFRKAFGNAAPPDALYVVEIGGNDVRDALAAFVRTLQGGGTQAQAQAAADQVISDAVTALGVGMRTLVDTGARQFLVWRLPNVGATPAINRLAAPIPAVAGLLTQAFNSTAEASVFAPLEASGVRVVRLDVHGKVNQILASPSDFGLSNAADACIRPGVPPFQCRRPDEYFFWDGIHPTSAGHAIIAQDAAYALAH